jgi:hypothetical protein
VAEGLEVERLQHVQLFEHRDRAAVGRLGVHLISPVAHRDRRQPLRLVALQVLERQDAALVLVEGRHPPRQLAAIEIGGAALRDLAERAAVVLLDEERSNRGWPAAGQEHRGRGGIRLEGVLQASDPVRELRRDHEPAFGQLDRRLEHLRELQAAVLVEQGGVAAQVRRDGRGQDPLVQLLLVEEGQLRRERRGPEEVQRTNLARRGHVHRGEAVAAQRRVQRIGSWTGGRSTGAGNQAVISCGAVPEV